MRTGTSKSRFDSCEHVLVLNFRQKICFYYNSHIFNLYFSKEFMDSNPSLFQIKSEIQHYDSIEQEIDDIEPIIVLEFIELSTGKVAIKCTRQQLDTFKLLFFFFYKPLHHALHCVSLESGER